MPKKLTNINFMMELVASYLADKSMPRYFFEDLLHLELERRYRKMASEYREYAEVFYDYIMENGVDADDGLSDSEFKKLIRRQYREVKDIANGGFF